MDCYALGSTSCCSFIKRVNLNVHVILIDKTLLILRHTNGLPLDHTLIT